MPVLPLAQLALLKIPYSYIAQMTLKEKTSIHYELYPLITFPRTLRNRSLRSMCDCKHYGRCLCYLERIKTEMISQFWNTDDDYRTLSDWVFPPLV